eukprot:CAMPEP_0172568326 /NCGR_PEP_ID=MMETSP1067-20121228/119535_1 /TAXON_ID=265564 ORGANISM="Thalassiosira punctigera, Strain Tpunct2005C2" /NCGR_SAMPLE_ID=MMETSP1067 /ASSEMBLY_ACC=CAM_ASM_000444 /LENGTH=302 /DNA_ID=CAMNT_0013359901 /DNA_START=37 /DNA_END=945 /DNA_ORIENTATION=+
MAGKWAKKRAKKRKIGSSSPAPPDDPLEYASLMRARAREHVSLQGEGGEEDHDIAQIIREVRAILAVNAEILDRCVPHLHSLETKKGSTSATFEVRGRYDAVTVITVKGETHFLTRERYSYEKFCIDPLLTLPDCLEDIISVKYKEVGHLSVNCVDFDTFFQNSLSLHDEVLGPFIANLKDHLENIQVCLGEIDGWIMGGDSNAKFLERVFDMKLSKLRNCNMGAPKCTGRRKREQQNAGRPDSDSCENSSGSDCENSSGSAYKDYGVLKICEELGEYKRTFDITKEDERSKLKRFIEFMAN